MKLLIAIVDRDDATGIAQNLSRRGFSSTKLASSGGFLMAGNATLLVGVEDKKVQTVLDIIKEYSHARKQTMPSTTELSYGYYLTSPAEIPVGGATIFVVDVDRFEKI